MEQLWHPSTWGYNSQELVEPGLNLSDQVSAVYLIGLSMDIPTIAILTNKKINIDKSI